MFDYGKAGYGFLQNALRLACGTSTDMDVYQLRDRLGRTRPAHRRGMGSFIATDPTQIPAYAG